MRRPLRSVMLCNPSYLSVYTLGVAQAMGMLGHWHRELSIFDQLDRLERQLDEMRPDIIWTHTIPWVAAESPSPGWLYLDLLARYRKRGARVLLHDGDARAVRYPHDMAGCFDLGLCNHTLQRSEWRIQVMRWPYAAMVQRQIGEPVDSLRCGLLFAGIVRKDDGLYSARTDLLGQLRSQLGERFTVRTGGSNDRMRVADVAPSAQAVMGFGRPEIPGWVDSRCFQYPGAGGVLIHDDAAEFLIPGAHYEPFNRGANVEATAASIIEAFARVGHEDRERRERAFAHVQKHHTWRNRVEQVLELFGWRS